MDIHILSPDDDNNFLNVFIFSFSSSFDILFIFMTTEFMNLSVLAFFFLSIFNLFKVSSCNLMIIIIIIIEESLYLIRCKVIQICYMSPATHT